MIADILHQELNEALKSDRQKHLSNLGAAVQNVKNIAQKGGVAAKNIASKISKCASSRVASTRAVHRSDLNETPQIQPKIQEEKQIEIVEAPIDDKYIIMENFSGEEDIKIALVTFF